MTTKKSPLDKKLDRLIKQKRHEIEALKKIADSVQNSKKKDISTSPTKKQPAKK